jgi:hypothetical protein
MWVRCRREILIMIYPAKEKTYDISESLLDILGGFLEYPDRNTWRNILGC